MKINKILRYTLFIFTIILGLFACESDRDTIVDSIINTEEETVVEEEEENDEDGINNPEENVINLVTHFFTKNAGPDKNPLKGWNSGWWNDHEFSSVGFQYIKWSEFEPTNGSFDYNYIEDVINRPGSKGRHLILRLYADWYGQNQDSEAGPSWLYEDLGVKRLQDGDKYLTDFNDEKFIKEAKEAIAALAERYDNDPRMYVFQIGMLGYWGEWHNHGFEYDISELAENSILEAYTTNFEKVKAQGRYPWREPLKSYGSIGFHNDFFGPVAHSFEFDDAITEGGQWAYAPVGGEYPPEVTDSQYHEMYATLTGMEIIETGHYSTMQASNACEENPNNCDGFMDLHRRMGYNYQIEKAVFAEQLTKDDSIESTIEFTNIGVAPMYYDWNIQVALLKNTQVIKHLDLSNYNLKNIQPDTSFTIEAILTDLNNIDTGDYELAIRIIQPDADTQKNTAWGLDARNTYILFSNELEYIEGVWDSNKVLLPFYNNLPLN